MLNTRLVKRSRRSFAFLFPLTTCTLLFASGCTGKSPSTAPTESPKALSSPSSPAEAPSTTPSPLVTPSLALGPCDRTLIEVVETLQAKTDEAMVRYAHTKRIPSRENFKLTYAAFLEAQTLLKQLSERFPAAECEAPAGSPGVVRRIEVNVIRTDTLARIASPQALIEENRLN